MTRMSGSKTDNGNLWLSHLYFSTREERNIERIRIVHEGAREASKQLFPGTSAQGFRRISVTRAQSPRQNPTRHLTHSRHPATTAAQVASCPTSSRLPFLLCLVKVIPREPRKATECWAAAGGVEMPILVSMSKLGRVGLSGI